MTLIAYLGRLNISYSRRMYLAFSGLSFCLLILWWGAYFPGCLSPDSWDQWSQSHNLGLLNDSHPVLYTLLIFALRLIWDSPGVLILFNIILFSHIIGVFLVFLYRKGVRMKILLFFVVFITLNPTNGRMVVAFWKDITYALGLLYLFVVYAKLVADNEKVYIKSFFVFEFLISFFLVLISRHNGIFVVLLSLPLFIYIVWGNNKLIFKLTMFSLLLIYSNKMVRSICVKDDGWYKIEHVMIRHLGSYLVSGNLTEKEKLLMLQIMPHSAWKRSYSPWTHDGLAFGPYGDNYRNLVPKMKTAIRKLFFNKVREKPIVFLKSQLSISQLIWRPIPEAGSYLNTYCVDCGDGVNKSLRLLADNYTSSCHTIYTRYLFWMGPLYIWLNFLIFIILFCTNSKSIFLVCTPQLLNVISVALVCPAQDFRYVYPSVIVFPFLLILLILNLKNFRKYIAGNLETL